MARPKKIVTTEPIDGLSGEVTTPIGAVTFIGDGDSDPDVIEAFGCIFFKNKPTYVYDEYAFKKLSANSHFEVSK